MEVPKEWGDKESTEAQRLRATLDVFAPQSLVGLFLRTMFMEGRTFASKYPSPRKWQTARHKRVTVVW